MRYFSLIIMLQSVIYCMKYDLQEMQLGKRGSDYRAWIYFTDKGLETEADLEVALHLSLDNLNERTKQRRSKTRGPKMVDNRDIPVSPDYIDEITVIKDSDENIDENIAGEKDELYNKAVDIIKTERKASTSFLQRKLQIGYNRAARIMETMEKEGIVGQANHVGKREIL